MELLECAMACERLNMGDPEPANRVVERVPQRLPPDGEYFFTVLLAYSLERWQDALHLVEIALAQENIGRLSDPVLPWCHALAGYASTRLGDFKAAVAHYNRARSVALDPHDFDEICKCAELALKHGE